MNKNDLIRTVAGSTGLSKAQAAEAVEGVFRAIAYALMEGDEVRVPGFGSFSVMRRAGSQGRNPRTGESIYIPSSRRLKFKAAKALKDAVN